MCTHSSALRECSSSHLCLKKNLIATHSIVITLQWCAILFFHSTVKAGSQQPPPSPCHHSHNIYMSTSGPEVTTPASSLLQYYDSFKKIRNAEAEKEGPTCPCSEPPYNIPVIHRGSLASRLQYMYCRSVLYSVYTAQYRVLCTAV